MTYLGTCSIQTMDDYAKKNVNFAKDTVVCSSLAHMMIYSFFYYAGRNVADVSFNPVISFVKIIHGRFSVMTVRSGA